MNRSNKTLAIGSFALILATSGLFSPVYAQPQPSSSSPPPSAKYQISETMLQEYVTDQNKQLPTAINESIRWDSIALGQERTLIHNYTVLDPSLQGFPPQQVQEMQSSLITTACNSQQLRLLLNDAIRLSFKFTTLQGNFLTEIRVDRNDCRGGSP
jgi:hypothetical protein